jgi:DNA modification methylase
MIKSEDIELGGVCVKVFNDDCLNVLREMPDNSVDSIVTDPPYGISFMAKKWTMMFLVLRCGRRLCEC